MKKISHYNTNGDGQAVEEIQYLAELNQTSITIQLYNLSDCPSTDTFSQKDVQSFQFVSCASDPSVLWGSWEAAKGNVHLQMDSQFSQLSHEGDTWTLSVEPKHTQGKK